MIRHEKDKIIYHYDAEELWIEPWGKDSVRIRATKSSFIPERKWALLEPEPVNCTVRADENGADLVNGKIRVHLTSSGKITIYNQNDKLLLEEYWRNRKVNPNIPEAITSASLSMISFFT